jgi:hypothetical protein
MEARSILKPVRFRIVVRGHLFFPERVGTVAERFTNGSGVVK